MTKKRFRKLDPIKDSKGLIGSNGRLSQVDLPEEVKHPILLPGEHPLTHLLAHFVSRWESMTFPFKYYCSLPFSFFDSAGKDRNLADTDQYFDLQSLLRTCQLSLAAVLV